MSKVLLISKGGTKEQTIKSIQLNEPEYIIFFCSKGTSKDILDISVEVKDKIGLKDTEKIVTESPEDMYKCFNIILKRLPQILKNWDLDFEDLVVDYTGGTKVMSASIVLATINFCSKYSYLGGTSRTKNGLGIVNTGSEQINYQFNPWNRFALNELATIEALFNKNRFKSAIEKINDIKVKLDSKLKDIYESLESLCNAYYEWDSFNHRKALTSFKKAYHQLKNYRVINAEEFNDFLKLIESNMDFLNNLQSEKKNNKYTSEGYKLLSIDLLSNAIRKAERENRFDDAVVRLYSAVEKNAKFKLLEMGIDNSNTSKDQIPKTLLEEFSKHYNDKKKCYQYGFTASYELLAEKDEAYKEKYNNCCKDLEKITNIRNNSYLAHGIDPISEENYRRLLEIVLDFFGLEEQDLVHFPKLNISIWVNKII